MADDDATYDIAGNVVIEKDPNGHAQFYSFNDGYADGQGRNTYALATSATNALNQISTASYDYGAGKVVSQTDGNRVTTLYAYNDALDRLTQVRRAVGSGSESQSNYVYPNAHTMLAYQDKDAAGDRGLQSQMLYDGFGRVAESDTAESGSQVIATCRTYDALGAVQTVSNPFRATGSAVCPGSGVPGTSYVNDSLGRSYRVIRPDGTYVESDYAGNGTTVTDEAGHTRKTIRDVLGRVVLVYEDLSGNNYQTGYRYDPLGDLTQVMQGAQQRTFGYDGLQRLRSAANPESGTVSYTYDAAGNLQTKTDARGVTTTYTYDALNRPLMKQYSGEASGIQTQPVTYSYDTNTNGVGRLASVSNTNSTTSYPEYDALGRMVQSVQTTGSGTYPFTYRYNLAGSLISETYPSGRVVTTAYDGAGRASGVSGSLGGTAASYAVAGYEPSGAYTTIGYGNNVVQHFWYDNRLRPQSMRTAYQDNPAQTDLQLTNSWLANGNLQGQTLDRGAAWLPVLSQAFGYDGLNRLTASAETNAANVGTWARNYQSDQYGNTWITAFAGVAPQGDAPQAQGAFDPLTNRLVNRPFNYDSAGNQGIVNGNALSYDAENRLVAVSESLSMGGGFTGYLYDGDGRRVGKFDSSGNNTNYVYDAQGLLVAEYGTTAQAPCATCYLSWDQIGSTRLVTDQNGQVVARHDYLPFGEELGTVAGRGSDGTNPNDTIRQKFTGKEHDQESGLDYFGARYYGGAMGRWTGADEVFADQDEHDPQSWNLYSYGRNNPLINVDFTGRKCVQTSNGPADDGTGGGCEAAGVSASGKITPQVFDVNDQGDMFTTISGVRNQVLANGHTIPVSERGIDANETANLLPFFKGLAAGGLLGAMLSGESGSLLERVALALGGQVVGGSSTAVSVELASGALVTFGAEKVGTNLTVDVSGAVAFGSAGNLFTIRQGLMAAARSEGAETLTIVASKVGNPALQSTLTRAGFESIGSTTFQGQSVEGFAKTFSVR